MSDKLAHARSRKFIWWYIGILAVPTVGIVFVPSLNAIWVLVLLLNTGAFAFNMAMYFEPGVTSHARTNRLLFFAISGMFALMGVVWAARLAMSIYSSGTLAM